VPMPFFLGLKLADSVTGGVAAVSATASLPWLRRRRRLLGAGDCSSEGHEQGEGDRLHGLLLVHGESVGNPVPFLQSTDGFRRFAELIVAGFEPPGAAPRVDHIRKERYFSGRYRLGDSRPNRKDG
jgi:hypothetical protein